MPFSDLGLSAPILKSVAEQAYKTPTPIQAKAIPCILAGKNLIACAQTGTGKTASFVLPILQKLSSKNESLRAKRISVLILTPTRELAIQIDENIRNYARYVDITSFAAYGGVDDEPQKQQLLEGIDILVATPGRLLDLAHQRAVHFDQLQTLVLDEADRMLDMGFIGDINKIIERLPTDRQNLLFSATLPQAVRQLAQHTLSDAEEIVLTPTQETAQQIKQWLVTVDKDKKSALLSHLIHENKWQQALIFIRTKHGAAKLANQLQKRGIKCEAIHSDKSQAMRAKILADFKSGELNFLIATGIASRGIDIDDLDRVINYDLPDDADDYIHRIGRTGRAQASGEAVSLVSKDDFKRLCAIERRLDHIIIRNNVEEFAAQKVVPISKLDFKAKHIPKPKPDKKTVASTPRKKPAVHAKTGRTDPWAQWKK